MKIQTCFFKLKTMKKLILLAILFSGCDKPEKETFEIPKKGLKVVEYATNLPIAGASLKLYEIGFYTSNCIYSGLTDSNGICRVPINYFTNTNLAMGVTKAKYWGYYSRMVENQVSLQPAGWLELHIQKASFYTTDTKLSLMIYTTENTTDYSQFNTAADSIIYVTGFGNKKNNIEWRVTSDLFGLMKNGTIIGLDIPKFDTLTGIKLLY
jgi:hypothetical protein